MKIVQINALCKTGSTGKICADISKFLVQNNIENYIFYSLANGGDENSIKFTSKNYIKLQALKSRIFGNYGLNSKRATKKLITEISKIDPDIVHLHNIHSHDVNLELLFNYLKATNAKIIWTFHDCWAFTGYCTHFDMIGCNKWTTQCKNCIQKNSFSWFSDRSTSLFEKKKQLFSNLNLTIVTPSKWMSDLVRKSFLSEYPVKVINNGINLDIFKPTDSDFRAKYNIPKHKNILLGVAFGWSDKKGLHTFIELSKRLDNNFQIVLVGTNKNIDKQLPNNIISIHKTESQSELAKIYTAADLFINPTLEENFPTVNIEAIACGTPVVTYETGGSPECIDETCGTVVPKNDIDSLFEQIILICKEKPFSKSACIDYAKNLSRSKMIEKYYDTYRGVI